MKPTVYIKDCATGEEIIREMNDKEYEQYLKNEENWQAELAAKAAAKRLESSD